MHGENMPNLPRASPREASPQQDMHALFLHSLLVGMDGDFRLVPLVQERGNWNAKSEITLPSPWLAPDPLP